METECNYHDLRDYIMSEIFVEITQFRYNSLKLYRTIATIIVVPFLVLNVPVLLRLALKPGLQLVIVCFRFVNPKL